MGTHSEHTENPLGIHRVAGTHWELMGSENYWQPACQNQANLREIQWEAIRNPLRMGHKAPNGNPTLNAAKTKGTHFKPTRNPLQTLQKPGEPTGNPLGTHWGTHFKCCKNQGNPLEVLLKCCKSHGNPLATHLTCCKNQGNPLTHPLDSITIINTGGGSTIKHRRASAEANTPRWSKSIILPALP